MSDMRSMMARRSGALPTFDARGAVRGERMALYKTRDCYHHGQGVDSRPRSHGADAAESGRSSRADLARARKNAVADFDTVLAMLESEGKDD